MEYYGWVNLSDSTYASDDNEMDLIVSKVSASITENRMSDSTGFIKIHRVNGASHLLVSVKANRLTPDVADIFELYDLSPLSPRVRMACCMSEMTNLKRL